MRIIVHSISLLIALSSMTVPVAASDQAPAGWTKVSRTLAESCKWEGENSNKRQFFSWLVSASTEERGAHLAGQNSVPKLTCVTSPEEASKTGKCAAQRYSNAFVLETPNGVIEGLNAGEFGGGLIWKGFGREHVTLLDEPVRYIHATRSGFLVFGGLNHMGSRRGAVWRVDVRPDRSASIQLILRLFSSPHGISVGRNGSVIVSTRLGVIRVTEQGKGEELLRSSSKISPMARPGERHPLNDKSELPKPFPPRAEYTWHSKLGATFDRAHQLYSTVEMTPGVIWGTTTSSMLLYGFGTEKVTERHTAPLLVRIDGNVPTPKATFFMPPNCQINRNGSGVQTCSCSLD